jgi:plastocyanin
VRSFKRWMIFGCWSFLMGVSSEPLRGQGVDVSAKILIRKPSPAESKKHLGQPTPVNVVVWLTPLKPGMAKAVAATRQTPYRLIQKDKMFTPHLLVVPTGSQVEFPNEDPFFHNVFSLFNGKRFDLGLYESGTSRSVRFDREGVSYIFCNIHPEMGAIVLALSTPYYGVSNENGFVTLHDVPSGNYRLNVWSENGQLVDSKTSEGTVQVSTEPVHLGEILLQAAMDPLVNHKNKFDEDYKPSRDPKY